MDFFHSRTALYVLLALVTITVLSGQHLLPPMDRDESRFAQASRQMLQSGDYVTIRFQDELRAKKPAGIYWLQATFANILGENDIASYRFVNLLALLTSVFILYHIGLRLYEPPLAFAASVAFSSSFIVFAEAHLAKTDTVLMLVIMIQQWALMRIYLNRDDNGQKPTIHWIWFWGALSTGLMIKGPVALAVALSTLGGLMIWDRRVDWINHLRFWRGITLLVAICLPWALLVSIATDGTFLDAAIKGDFLAKIKSGQESHSAPPLSYLALFGLLLWPVSTLLPTTFTHLRMMLKHDATRFLLAWLVPFWVIIELIPTKLPHYPLPVAPALALLLTWSADYMIKLPSLRKNFVLTGNYFLLSFGIFLALATIAAAVIFGGDSSRVALSYAIFATFVVGLAIWQGHSWIQTCRYTHLVAFLTAGILVHFIILAGVVPNLARIHVADALAKHLKYSESQSPTIAAAGYHEPSLVFLLGRDVLLVGSREAALFLAEATDGIALVEARQQAAFLDMAQRLGLELMDPEQVAGYNISKGEDVIILIYKREIFDDTSDN